MLMVFMMTPSVPALAQASTQASARAETQAETPGKILAEAITAEAVARHLDVMAHDSMVSRDTPSPGLMKTAQYIADQFKALGLTPGGDLSTPLAGKPADTTWFQRYPIPGNRELDYAATQLAFRAKLRKGDKRMVDEAGGSIEKQVNVTFTSGARFAVDTVPESGAGPTGWSWLLAPPGVCVVSGTHTVASLQAANLRDKVVIYIPSPDADSVRRQQLFDQLYAWNHVLIMSDEDSASFHEAARRRPSLVVDKRFEKTLGIRRWASYIRPEALGDFLNLVAALDVPKVRADPTPTVRELPGLRIDLEPKLAQEPKDTATAVNVVGILEGTGPDSTTKADGWEKWTQYIVISAHMDNLGVTNGQADRIHNGANDNASGVAGLLELAKAFSQPGARHRRSIVFLATSGSTKEHWGSTYWVDDWVKKTLAVNINLDRIGAKTGDAIMVNGMDDLELPIRPDWVAAQHPELRLTVIDGGTISTPQSDHFAFVRRAVPSLYFHNERDDENPLVDSASTVDPALEARILKLVFHVTQELANHGKLPVWSTAGRRQRIEILGE